MNPETWLEQNTNGGYALLTPPEREAIKYFSLLWSLFEYKCLKTEGDVPKIISLVQRIEADGHLNPNAIATAAAYFRNRYFHNGAFTHHYPALNVHQKNTHLVEGFLTGQANSAGDTLTALLVIVYRLRNNLFHGVKWTYYIQGQADNFIHASGVLMATMDMDHIN